MEVPMERPNALLPTLVLTTALVACGGNPAKPDGAEAQAPAVAGTAAAPAEGQRIEGVKLSPEVIEIAKTEGEVKLTKDDRVQCEKYKPLGSNRTQYRCRTKAEAVQSVEDNNREMRKLQTPPPAAHGTLGK
jgi:hypothetical protein